MKEKTTAKVDATTATAAKAAVAPVAAEVKTEVKAPVKEVAVEKTAAKGVSEEKKTEEKKTTEKKATKTTEKKATEKKATKTTAKKALKEELKPEVFIQYQGNEAVVADAVEKAKAVYVAAGHRVSSIKSLQVYLKPEEYAAYFVINQKFAGRVDLF